MSLVPLPARFWKKINADGPTPPHRPELGPCWIWTGKPEESGYTRCDIRGVRDYVHRHTYRAEVGPIPDGLEIDHLCRNRACCRPSHLEAVTHAENQRRRRLAACKYGHPLTGDNVYERQGNRYCRECNVRRQQEWRDRQKAG